MMLNLQNALKIMYNKISMLLLVHQNLICNTFQICYQTLKLFNNLRQLFDTFAAVNSHIINNLENHKQIIK